MKVADVTLADLSFLSDNCHGVYLFQQGKNYKILEKNPQKPYSDYWYIGKCVGRTLAERIGGHLAPRQADYMNMLLKYIARVKKQDIDRIFPIMLDLKLKIVCFGNASDPKVKEQISAAETLLIKRLRPFLNNPKRDPRKLSIHP